MLNTTIFSQSEFLSFLSSNVETIRSATSDSPPPVFTPTDCNLSLFDLCHPDDVLRIIKASPAKSCDLDPVPTFLIKEYLDVMLPFLTRLCNTSIQSGCLPFSQKTAMVTPRLKKSGLDPAAIQNYRPISNLPFMSKVIEKLILAQLSRYLAANNLFPDYQSGFRRHHSTETAILRVFSDIYAAIDRDQVSLLALLDNQCSVRHCGSQHPTRTSFHVIRALWDGFHLAGVLHYWTCAGHPCWWMPVYPRHGLFWCPSRFSPRTSPVCPSHSRYHQAGRVFWPSSSLSTLTTPSFMNTVVRLLQLSCQLRSYRQSTRSTPGCHQITSRATQGKRSSYGLVHGLV